MGAEASRQEPGADDPAPEGSETNAKDTEEAYSRLINGQIDADEAFKDAFENEAELEEIRRIVDMIAGQQGETGAVTAEVKHLEKMAKEQEKRDQKANKAVTKNATRTADDWFEQQLRQGKSEEETIRASKEAERASKAAATEKDTEMRAARETERLQGRKEQAAREALFNQAEESRFMASANSFGKVFEGIPVPAQPVAPGEGGDVCPEPPEKKKTRKKDPPPELYELLDVSVDATYDEIKKGYRKQALKWHPDKNRQRLEYSTERFQKISEAFDTLYDPQKKEAYDAGVIKDPGKVKKLQGHGWSAKSDEDDECLTALGIKYKKNSWRSYVFLCGRIDDDPAQLVFDDSDPRAAQERIKIFWRFVGEMAYVAREESGEQHWLQNYVRDVWKDTPSKWPGAVELKNMNDSAQQEWKERRMVYNRRKQKVLFHIEMHEDYLAIPDREEKEIERIHGARPGWAQRMSGAMGPDPFRATG